MAMLLEHFCISVLRTSPDGSKEKFFPSPKNVITRLVTVDEPIKALIAEPLIHS
jgi:hypothetical protein